MWTSDPPSQLHPQRKREATHILKVILHLSPEASITVQTHANKHLKTTTEGSCADWTLYLFLKKKKGDQSWQIDSTQAIFEFKTATESSCSELKIPFKSAFEF